MPTQVTNADPNLIQLLVDQINLNRHLIYMTWGVLFITGLFVAMQAIRMVRRYSGFKALMSGNGVADPLDDVTTGHFDKVIQDMNETAAVRTETAVNEVKKSLDIQIKGVNLQLRSQRRSLRFALVYLRALAMYVITGEKPTQDLPLVELEEEPEES